MGGAFLISREIFNNPIWLNITEFRLFFLIVGRAVFAEEGQQIGRIKINKGQWLRSYRNLQSDLEYIDNSKVKKPGLSTIQRAVDNLVADGRITVELTELGTLFTVVNYRIYQDLFTYKKEAANADRNADRNRRGTDAEQARNNNNNAKKAKKENIYTPEFEQWYSEFPRPEAKRESFLNFEKVHKSKGLNFILNCTRNYIDYRDSIPEKERGPAYSSRNFFGTKAYYEDFINPKQYKSVEQKNGLTVPLGSEVPKYF